MGSDLNFAADRQMADAGGCGTSECNAPGYLVQANGLCTDCNLDAASDSMGSASSGSGSATSSSSSSYSHSSVDSCDRSDGRAPALAQHDAWVERNSGRADPSLCIPYEDL